MDYKPAIKINNISKKYYRGALNEQSLRGITIHFWNNFNYKTIFKRKKREAFWAVRNINLEVKKGEILGIIGNNGAGKSTLLKLLAGITPPTEGSIEIFGRIAPMLEIGAGFHGDLSGKDNIFLNGAIMGMKRKEIEKHFKEIIEFSGLATFVETPLKYYSSGMRIRLAFAIAAFLQPEILLVDEVLAVGDVAFQKKCLAKMEERAKQGITILFVSHDLEAVKRLCDRCVYLDNGEIKEIGNKTLIIDQYLKDQNVAQKLRIEITKKVDKPLYITKVTLVNQRNEYLTTEQIPILISLIVRDRLNFPVQIWMEIRDSSRKIIIYSGIDISKEVEQTKLLNINLKIPSNSFTPGDFTIFFCVWNINGWIELDKTEQEIDITIVHELQKQTEILKEVPVVDCSWEVKSHPE
jgi:lipopolysaccharide transport system ATP-binding protein